MGVQGQRMAASETSKFSSKFSKTFSLDQTVDVEKFTASLKNGVLTVSAPKDLAKLEENIRRIPVMSAAATVDDDAAETAIASGDTESDSQKMEHKEESRRSIHGFGQRRRRNFFRKGVKSTYEINAQLK